MMPRRGPGGASRQSQVQKFNVFANMYDRGCQYLRDQQYDQAIEEFNRYIKHIELSNFVQGTCYAKRGMAYYHKKMYSKMVEDSRKAEQLGLYLTHEESYSFYTFWGLAHIELGQYDSAVIPLTTAVGINWKQDCAFQGLEKLYTHSRPCCQIISFYLELLEKPFESNQKICQHLEILLGSINNDMDLGDISKDNLLKAILKLAKHIPILHQCLYKGNPGDRMWVTEFPYTGCGYRNGGKLEIICKYLEENEPGFVWPADPVDNTPSLFENFIAFFTPKKFMPGQDDEVELSVRKEVSYSNIEK